MTWKDKLEIGLKDDAPFRRDNLPDFQRNGGSNGVESDRHGVEADVKPDDPTRSPEEPEARVEAARQAGPDHPNRPKPRVTARGTARTRRTPPRE